MTKLQGCGFSVALWLFQEWCIVIKEPNDYLRNVVVLLKSLVIIQWMVWCY
jgi:hypothetical protein